MKQRARVQTNEPRRDESHSSAHRMAGTRKQKRDARPHFFVYRRALFVISSPREKTERMVRNYLGFLQGLRRSIAARCKEEQGAPLLFSRSVDAVDGSSRKREQGGYRRVVWTANARHWRGFSLVVGKSHRMHPCGPDTATARFKWICPRCANPPPPLLAM
jgi:hypothetical protein